MDLAPNPLAVRFYAGDLEIATISTTGQKEYYLLSLPYFLVSQIDQYLEWFQKVIAEKKQSF
jgi:uncharacterized protein